MARERLRDSLATARRTPGWRLAVFATIAFGASVAVSRGVLAVVLIIVGSLAGLVLLGGILWLLGAVFPGLRRK